MKRVGELQQMGSVAIASPPHDRETSAFGITLDYWYYTPSCAGMSTPAQRVVVSGSTEKEKRVGYGESGGETVWHRVYTPHDRRTAVCNVFYPILHAIVNPPSAV